MVKRKDIFFGENTNKKYLKKNLFLSVPRYEYTSPQPIDRRRKKRSADGADDILEYIIEVSGEANHLILEKSKELISPGKIILVTFNLTKT